MASTTCCELTSGPQEIKLDLEGVERSVIEASLIDDHDCLLLFEDHAKIQPAR